MVLGVANLSCRRDRSVVASEELKTIVQKTKVSITATKDMEVVNNGTCDGGLENWNEKPKVRLWRHVKERQMHHWKLKRTKERPNTYWGEWRRVE